MYKSNVMSCNSAIWGLHSCLKETISTPQKNILLKVPRAVQWDLMNDNHPILQKISTPSSISNEKISKNKGYKCPVAQIDPRKISEVIFKH